MKRRTRDIQYLHSESPERQRILMKQLLQNLRTGKMTVAEVPIPVPKPGFALVRTAVSLISAGTERMVVEFAEKSLMGKARSRPDLVRQVIDKARREGLASTIESAFNRLDQPMPLGYSSSGTIVDVGEGLQGFKVGQRVACAGGGYAVHAEYTIVPQNLLAHLPDELDFESASFTTLGAIALHGFRLGEVQLGERVAIIGLGLLGLLTVQIAVAAGCKVLGIDLDQDRVSLAQKLGVSAALRSDAEHISQSFTDNKGFDAVIICADTPSPDPIELAGSIARDRARVVAVGAVGLNIPRKAYYEKELALINSRSYGPGRYDPSYEEAGSDYPIGYVRWTEGRNLQGFVDLLALGRVDVRPLISHRFPINEALNAYQIITGKRTEPFLGVLIVYDQADELVETRLSRVSRFGHLPSSSDGYEHDQMVSLGVLGAGNFAMAVMLPSIRNIPHLQLTGIASASGLNAQYAAGKYRFTYATSDEKSVVDDPSINTIAILTRHNMHARQVIAGIQAGKNVFCEKPLALTSEELDAIAAVLLEHPSSILMVGFNRRFSSLAKKMREFIRNREEPLYAHYRVNAGYLPPDHWLHDPGQGGGRLLGEACHFIDFLTFLVGDRPVSVSAKALPDLGRYRDDNIILQFSYPDGSIGMVSYLSNGDRSYAKEKVEVFTGGRIAILDDFRSLELVQQGNRSVTRSRLKQDKGHKAEWLFFINSIRLGGPPPIPYDHLFGVTKATFVAIQALHKGETIVIDYK